MCRLSNVDLIDGGSAGYLGQSRWYISTFSDEQGSKLECFDCSPAPGPKKFANCTIRSNPSQFVHCVVWAKHLFANLFGQVNESQNDIFETESGSQKLNIRSYAVKNNYNAQKIFNRLFNEDIAELESQLSVQNGTKITKLNFDDAKCDSKLQDYVAEFEKSLKEILAWHKKDGDLEWSKDDEISLNFVYAAANLRSKIFHLESKSQFDTKTIAGNIIPSVITTNAIVSGLMVNEINKYFQNKPHTLLNAYVKQNSLSGTYVQPLRIEKSNDNCFVCQKAATEIKIYCDFNKPLTQTIHLALKERYHMLTCEIMSMSGDILVNFDDTNDEIAQTKLTAFIENAPLELLCSDFKQDISINLLAFHAIDIDSYTFVNANSTINRAENPPKRVKTTIF